MLSCDEVRRKLSDAMDGRVPWWTRVQMRVHLAMCHECERIARSLRETLQTLRAMRDAPGADDDPAGSS